MLRELCEALLAPLGVVMLVAIGVMLCIWVVVEHLVKALSFCIVAVIIAPSQMFKFLIRVPHKRTQGVNMAKHKHRVRTRRKGKRV